MRKPGGYAIFTCDDGSTVERDTFTCCHCNRVEFVTPGSGKLRGWCFLCGASECGRSECSSVVKGCTSFERKLEEFERRHILHRMI